MNSIIIRKEIRNNIQSKLFIITTAVVLFLCILSFDILISKYNEKTKEYHEYLIANKKIFDNATYGSLDELLCVPVRPIPSMGMFFKGITQFRGVQAVDKNPVPYLFPDSDIFFFIAVLMSLLAVVFSYDAISGEREDGMLKSIFVYPIKRGNFLFGKWVGIMCSLMFPYVLCYLSALLVVQLRSKVSWSFDDWIAILLIFITGLLYISMFVLLGLYVSSKVKRSYAAMLISLLIWGGCLLIIPTLPDYLGKAWASAPSPSELIYNQHEFYYEQQRRVSEIRNKYLGQGIAPEKIDSVAKKDIDRIIAEVNKKRNEYITWFDNKVKSQLIISTSACVLSPYSCFMLAGNEFASTGFISQMSFQQQSQHFEQQLRQFIALKKQQLVKRGGEIKWDTKLDLTGRPTFVYQKTPLGKRLIAGIIPGFFIVMYNILMFVLAFRAFQRQDIR